MEQMKCYENSPHTRYEDLSLNQRIDYWTDYLQRLVNFTLTESSLTPDRINSLLAEIERINQLLRVLRTTPHHATKPSSINPTILTEDVSNSKSISGQDSSIQHTGTRTNSNIRPSRKLRPARRHNDTAK